MPIINRCFANETVTQQIKKDFGFLISAINGSAGEYVLQIRGPKKFNVYYRGNSMLQAEHSAEDIYKITIHQKFTKNVLEALTKLSISRTEKKSKTKSGDSSTSYYVFSVKSKSLKSFLKKSHLASLESLIKKTNYKEELTAEQAILTDNLANDKIIIIDTEIGDHTDAGKTRADFLALERVSGNKYRFLVIELKLGNNKELDVSQEKNVLKQISGYLDKLNRDEVFTDYVTCYKESIAQRKQLGLIQSPMLPEGSEIVKDTKGLIVVTHYSGIAKPFIELLQKKLSPDISFKQIHYTL